MALPGSEQSDNRREGKEQEDAQFGEQIGGRITVSSAESAQQSERSWSFLQADACPAWAGEGRHCYSPQACVSDLQDAQIRDGVRRPRTRLLQRAVPPARGEEPNAAGRYTRLRPSLRPNGGSFLGAKRRIGSHGCRIV